MVTSISTQRERMVGSCTYPLSPSPWHGSNNNEEGIDEKELTVAGMKGMDALSEGPPFLLKGRVFCPRLLKSGADVA